MDSPSVSVLVNAVTVLVVVQRDNAETDELRARNALQSRGASSERLVAVVGEATSAVGFGLPVTDDRERPAGACCRSLLERRTPRARPSALADARAVIPRDPVRLTESREAVDVGAVRSGAMTIAIARVGDRPLGRLT